MVQNEAVNPRPDLDPTADAQGEEETNVDPRLTTAQTTSAVHSPEQDTDTLILNIAREVEAEAVQTAGVDLTPTSTSAAVNTEEQGDEVDLTNATQSSTPILKLTHPLPLSLKTKG